MLLRSLFNKYTSCLGVHIDTNAVRLIEISVHDTRYRVDAFSQVSLEAGAIDSSGKIINSEALTYALSLAKGAITSRASQVATAVPGSTVVTKVFQLVSRLPKCDREAQAWIEASNCFPCSPKELMLDFYVMGESKSNPDEVDILLVVVHTEDVQPRIDAMAAAGITADIVDVDYFVLGHTCKLILENSTSPLDTTIAYISVSDTTVKLTVLNDLNVIYTREVSFGSEQKKQEGGLIGETIESNTIEGGETEKEDEASLQRVLVLHIRRAIQFFYSASEYNEVKMLILGGSCARFEGLTELVEEYTGITTVVADPFANMKISRSVNKEELQREAPNLVIACGLALRGIRL